MEEIFLTIITDDTKVGHVLEEDQRRTKLQENLD